MTTPDQHGSSTPTRTSKQQNPRPPAGTIGADPRGSHDEITVAVARIIDRRALIEQAKGMIMMALGVDADAAFGVLRWQSQHHNVKLRVLAEQIVCDLTQASRNRPPMLNATYAKLITTAHTRIEPIVLPDNISRVMHHVAE